MRDVIESISPVDGVLLLMRAIKAYIFDRRIRIIIHLMLIDRSVEIIVAVLADKCAEFRANLGHLRLNCFNLLSVDHVVMILTHSSFMAHELFRTILGF